MQKIHFSIEILAPRQKVWDTMFGNETYRVWAAVFMPGSHFIGNWQSGSKMQFVSQDEQGQLSGMSSLVAEARMPEFLLLRHQGLVKNGVEDLTSPEAKKWISSENYFFRDLGDKTELVVEQDSQGDFKEYLEEAWPKALKKIKELAEK